MRKLFIFIISLVAIAGLFFVRVNANETLVTIQSATASTSDSTSTLDLVVRAESNADTSKIYSIDFNNYLDGMDIVYLDRVCTIKYALASAPSTKYDYPGQNEYRALEETQDFTLLSGNAAILYYFHYEFDLEEGNPNGNVSQYFTITSKEGNVTPVPIDLLSTTASIVMNTSSGKGTLSGEIDFSTNTYKAGWYAMDLNYIKEYYSFKTSIATASFSCSTNSSLNSVVSGSVNIDTSGNVVYFALPNLASVTDKVTYSVVFGEAATGANIANVGSRVKLTTITNELSTKGMAFSDENYSYIVSVDNPKTIEQIIAACSIKAYDNRDGEKQITYTDTNNYVSKVTGVNTVESRTLGNYNVTLNATDAKANASSLQLKLIVKDLTKPIINTNESTLSYERSYNDEVLSDQVLISGIKATDNYAAANTLTISVDSSSYQSGHATVSNYSIPVTVADPSGNQVNGSIVVRVVDLVAPVITGNTTFSTSYTSDITASEIVEKCEIVATDELDGNVDVTIITDNYSANKNIPGVYTIVVRAKDHSNNASSFTITVTVTDNITPYFLVNKTTLVVENGYAYTPNEIIDVAVSSGLIRMDYLDVEVVTDEYSANTQVDGTYLYRLKVTYDDGEEYVDINLKVVNPEKPVKVKWYMKVGNFFTRTFSKVGHFFSDVVYEKGIKRLFDAVKSVWKSIFRRR